MKKVHAYLNFDGNAEEALDFYRNVFGGEFMGVFRYGDGGNPMKVSDADKDKIMHMALPLPGGFMLMASDITEAMGRKPDVGNNLYLYLECDSAEEVDRLVAGLAEGGNVEMEPARTEWAERFGMCGDRFGVHWMIGYEGSVQFAQP